jgi:integrase
MSRRGVRPTWRARVPVVLSPEEVARFLEAAPGVKYKAAFSVAYGAGPRVSEVAALKVSDIDSERMMPRVEQGNPLRPTPLLRSDIIFGRHRCTRYSIRKVTRSHTAPHISPIDFSSLDRQKKATSFRHFRTAH